MRTLKHFVIGFFGVTFLIGAVGLVQPPPSQADVQFEGIKKILKKIFPPCGPDTRKDRFVVSKDGNSVCDNTTGLWWQQSPSTARLVWGPDQAVDNAIDHCANLTLSGKTWRLPEVRQLQSLVDYSEANQAAALNAGPFTDVQSFLYWSASGLAGNSTGAWAVGFTFGDVVGLNDGVNNLLHAWCVSGGQDAH